MKYEIYKQFPDKITSYLHQYRCLSEYLTKKGLPNRIAQPRFEVENVMVRGKLENDIEFYAEFSPVFFSCLRKEKSQMQAGIFFKNPDEETIKKVKNIAKLLMNYEI